MFRQNPTTIYISNWHGVKLGVLQLIKEKKLLKMGKNIIISPVPILLRAVHVRS